MFDRNVVRERCTLLSIYSIVYVDNVEWHFIYCLHIVRAEERFIIYIFCRFDIFVFQFNGMCGTSFSLSFRSACTYTHQIDRTLSPNEQWPFHHYGQWPVFPFFKIIQIMFYNVAIIIACVCFHALTSSILAVILS